MRTARRRKAQVSVLIHVVFKRPDWSGSPGVFRGTHFMKREMIICRGRRY